MFLLHLFYFISDVQTSTRLKLKKINVARTIYYILHLFNFFSAVHMSKSNKIKVGVAYEDFQ